MDAAPNSGSQQTRVELFCTRHQVEILYAFGSRAADMRAALIDGIETQAGQSSDIDIAVKLSGHRALSVREKADRERFLEKLGAVLTEPGAPC